MLIDRRRSIVAIAVLLAMSPGKSSAQGRLLVQGIADAEFWASDTMSNLLTRNAGRPSGLARLQLWAAAEPGRGLVLYAQGQATTASAKPAMEEFRAVVLHQLGVRYSRASWLTVDAGKISPIVGEFAPRRFSDRNPLIGVPDAYPTQYPVGLKVSGATRFIDYRAGILSIPVSHPEYVPNPDPVVGSSRVDLQACKLEYSIVSPK